MKRALIVGAIVLGTILMSGCPRRDRVIVLPDSQIKMIIPAGTPFRATMKKGTPLQTVVRDRDSWVVDAGYLFSLEREANRRVLRGEDDE